MTDSRLRPSPETDRAITDRVPLVAALIAVVAILTYLPALRIPFIEDDYPLIAQGSAYGEAGWSAALRDPVNRPRFTSLFLLDTVHRAADMDPRWYYAAGIALHVLNSLLVLALGAWKAVGYRVSAWAAAFFAVYEGHNEAVMWISANNELLLFFFGSASFVSWLHFLSGSDRRWSWYALSIAAYGFSLLSKESALGLIALLALGLVWPVRRLRDIRWLVPFVVLTAIWVASILATRGYSGHFHDGSFSLSAPFLLTWANSYIRLFWIWGLVACVAIWVMARGLPQPAIVGLVWAALALLPYVFLTYNTRVPSRHTYLASAGLALVAGTAFAIASASMRRRHVVTAAAFIVLVQNAGWIYTRKYRQYMERAQPTEQLIEFGKKTRGPIFVRCFPRNPIIAEQALCLMTGRQTSEVIRDAADARTRGAAEFCYRELK